MEHSPICHRRCQRCHCCCRHRCHCCRQSADTIVQSVGEQDVYLRLLVSIFGLNLFNRKIRQERPWRICAFVLLGRQQNHKVRKENTEDTVREKCSLFFCVFGYLFSRQRNHSLSKVIQIGSKRRKLQIASINVLLHP